MTQITFRTGALVIILSALIIRVAAALYLGNVVSGLSGAQDEISYSMLGQRFAAGNGLTFPEPWYPWIDANAPQSYYSAAMSLYLAAIYMVFGYEPLAARLVTALLGTAVVGMDILLARRQFGEKVALVSGVIAAVYAYLIFYGVTLVTETPFILALLTAIYLAYQIVCMEAAALWRWVALGVALAIAALFRMAVIFYVPVLLLWIVLRRRKEMVKAVIPIVLIVLAILPFTLRNYQMWGRFLLLESQFGHVFWNGNHPDQNGNFHPYKTFPITADVTASHNDAEITGRLLQMGIENVLHDPENFIWLTITRLREFFTFWPTTTSTPLANVMRLGSFTLLLPFAILGLWMTRARWGELSPSLMFFVIHTGVYAISWAQIRYRIPIDAIVIPFGALAIVTLVARIFPRLRI